MRSACCELRASASARLPPLQRLRRRGVAGVAPPPRPLAAEEPAPVEHLLPEAEEQEPEPVAPEELENDPGIARIWDGNGGGNEEYVLRG